MSLKIFGLVLRTFRATKERSSTSGFNYNQCTLFWFKCQPLAHSAFSLRLTSRFSQGFFFPFGDPVSIWPEKWLRKWPMTAIGR